MKKCITLTLLLLGCATPTKPISISITDTVYYIGTIAALHWVHRRIERMETLQEAQIRHHNSTQESEIPIPERPTFTGSLQELYRGGRGAAAVTAQTINGARNLHQLSTNGHSNGQGPLVDV